MSFLYPLFLIAGLSLAVPILIHLFNFRKYKKVLFPDIRFLRELQEQTKKQSKLRHLLILLARLGLLSCLVLAFAQPFFEKDRDSVTAGPKALSIYLDNSFSMGAQKGNLSLLDIAKSKAREIIAQCQENDQIQILSNSFGSNEGKFMQKDEALQHLETIQISSKPRKASAILDKQKKLLATLPGRKQQLVFISDFQKNQFLAGTPATDSVLKYFIRIQPEQNNNLSLDTAYFENPSLLLNEPNPITVRLKNYGQEAMQTALTLMVNGQLKSVQNVDLKARETKEETISFSTSTAGEQRITLFTTDYPMSFDDTFYVAGKVSSEYQVLVINQSQSNPFLSSVFRPGAQFRIDNHQAASVPVSILPNYSLIVLNGTTTLPLNLRRALTNFVNQGGHVLVFPPSNVPPGELNQFLTETAGCNLGRLDTAKSYVSSFNKSHALFKDLFVKTPENIDLPLVFRHYQLSQSALSSEQKLFTFSNGDAFLTGFRVGQGELFICTSPAELQSTNFPKSYWFLPIIYKMAFSGRRHAIQSLTLGPQATMRIENSKVSDKTTYHIRMGNWDAIPEQRAIGNQMLLNVNQAAEQAGLYGIYLPGSTDTIFAGINYDRSESALQFWTLEELKSNFKFQNTEWITDQIDLKSGLGAISSGMPLWKVCIILALIFMLVEIALIRWMK